MSGTNTKLLHSHDDNLETFSIVWLDAQVNTTEENRQTQQKLRQIINHLKVYDNEQRCHQYILSLSAQDRLILIVSGRLGRQLVPEIHHLRQLSSIYVYCKEKQINEQWSKRFTKVKRVIIRQDDLINKIKADQSSQMKLEEPLSFKICSESSSSDQSTTGLNGHFVNSLLLIDVLIRMKSSETEKQELITFWKNEYKQNSIQLALVHEFENQYTSNKALWWYTRDSFLHKILNKALRVQNIDLLFLFRFVIGDIYQQLKQYQCQSPVRVYRGQVISKDELNTLRRSIGKFISTTSFFSTSIDRRKALVFSDNSDISNDLCRILFIIDADPRVVKSKPFANISSFSALSHEVEVLFMIGCVFHLIDIRYDDVEKIWMIRMELCNDNEHDLNKLFNHLKKEFGCGENEVDFYSFGNILRHMGKYDLAEKIYNRLSDQLSHSDRGLADLYYSLGMLSKDRKEYDYSLNWFQQSLEIRMRRNPNNYIDIGGLYCCIGNVHMKKDNYQQAMECYNKAVGFYSQAQGAGHQHIAALYHGVGDAYFYQKKYPEALRYYNESMTIQEKCLPADHSDMAINLDSLGAFHLHFDEYDRAMSYHYRSRNIRLKSLPSQHPDIAINYKNIGLVYEMINEWKQALMNYQKAAIIYLHSLSSEHPNVIEIKKDIQRVLSKTNA